MRWKKSLAPVRVTGRVADLVGDHEVGEGHGAEADG